jgi:signal transduction histidine kinase
MFCTPHPDLVFYIFTNDIPHLFYYSHIPAIIISLLFGFFVFFKSKSDVSARILLLISIIFSLWIMCDMVSWISPDSRMVMLFWAAMNILEPLLYLLLLYFVYAFVEKGKTFFSKDKVAGFLFIIPIAILLPTTYNLVRFDIPSCEAVQGDLMKYIYFIEVLFSLWIVIYLIKSYRKAEGVFKKQLIYFSLGVVLFLVAFSWANIFGYLTTDWVVSQYGVFGMPVFIGFLAYIIVRYNAFNIRLIGAQTLIVSQFILIASMFAFIQNKTNITLTAITLLLTIIMGRYLVRSVKKEISLREELEASSQEILERRDQLQVMADKLAQSNDQLRVLDNAKSEFISIASHQLRTPLTAIKGFISLLLEGSYGEVPEKHAEVLNKIYISNERLINLVEDLLNISRIESGRMEFAFGQWDLDKMCKEVLDTFGLRAKDHNLYLQYVPPETPLPELTIDGLKVREVISNLVDNAIKYTLDGHGGVTLKLQQVRDNARITVSDTGIGIPPTEIPYLFAKFSRGKDVSRLNTGGTGLGLYVGRNMVESNGGKIWAESDGAGLGSRFIVEIPMVQSEEVLNKWK